jgi:hypothetical protein
MNPSDENQRSVPVWALNWALIMGIVILINIFAHYSMSLFYSEPDWQDYCGQDNRYGYNDTYGSQQECEDSGGRWIEGKTGRPAPAPVLEERASEAVESEEVVGWCDAFYECDQAYRDASEAHARYAFIIMLSASLVLTLIGFLVPLTSNIVSTSLSIGGVILILTSIGRYWRSADDYLQFFVLSAVLACFIWLAFRRGKK